MFHPDRHKNDLHYQQTRTVTGKCRRADLAVILKNGGSCVVIRAPITIGPRGNPHIFAFFRGSFRDDSHVIVSENCFLCNKDYVSFTTPRKITITYD